MTTKPGSKLYEGRYPVYLVQQRALTPQWTAIAEPRHRLAVAADYPYDAVLEKMEIIAQPYLPN
jgi:hypothetical protein